MNNLFFKDMRSCRVVYRHQYFGEACCLHLRHKPRMIATLAMEAVGTSESFVSVCCSRRRHIPIAWNLLETMLCWSSVGSLCVVSCPLGTRLACNLQFGCYRTAYCRIAVGHDAICMQVLCASSHCVPWAQCTVVDFNWS
jgi:hypothetical protein